ncbi:MAG TPA: hypothetical protein VMU34_25785, partial [Mycobacterium sp.]|nr:hypothetical protein [Mycobacterium sp.]
MDPSFDKKGNEVGTVVHPTSGHELGQSPGVVDSPFHEVSSSRESALLMVVSNTRRKVLTR